MYLDGFFPASFFSESKQSSWFCSGWRHPPRRSAKGLAVAKERCARSGEKILSNREPEREARAESDNSKTLIRFYLSFHPRQQCSGAAGVPADPPVVNFLDGDHVQVVPTAPAFALHDHQPGFFQHSKVLHHGAAVNLPEMTAEFAGGLGRLLEQVEDLAPAVIRQRFENQ